jgi:hypothetical protein
MAWRSENRLHLASDSRIKLGEEMYADVGIKVLALPVLITGTDPEPLVKFRGTYGFAYAGSFVNAGTFAELMAELLQNVQHVREDVPVSFISICDFLVDYCGRISTELTAYLAKNGRYEFVVAGLCPAEKRLRAASFQFNHDAGKATAWFKEVLEKDGDHILLGSGKAAASVLIRTVDLRGMLSVLDEVIDSGAIASVGGDIQYGSFKPGGDFGVSGVIRVTTERAEHEGHAYGPEEFRIFKYRGFKLYDNWDPMQQPLWVTPSFIELKVTSNSASKAAFRKFKGLPSEIEGQAE